MSAIINPGTIFDLLALIGLTALILIFIKQAEGGKQFFIRKIAAIDALEEAIGRCAELGKPLLFHTGQRSFLSSVESSMTLAGMSILGYAARLTAKHNVRLVTLVSKAESVPLHIELLKESYASEGKEYDFSDFYYFSDFFQAYLQNLIGITRQTKPGAFILLGAVIFEISMIPEVARAVGSMAIGGTAYSYYWIYTPLYDYGVIGEELYAASAYVTRDPVQVSAIVAEDIYKYICIIITILGPILLMFGINLSNLLKM